MPLTFLSKENFRATDEWLIGGVLREAPEQQEPELDLPGNPESGTVAEVQAWVEENPDAAPDVLQNEQARGEHARVTLTNWLESFITRHEDEDEDKGDAEGDAE